MLFKEVPVLPVRKSNEDFTMFTNKILNKNENDRLKGFRNSFTKFQELMLITKVPSV